jgi:arylsulfatase A-like enzyme
VSQTIEPNIVLISIDSLRSDHLGCYGYDKPTSPTIDWLAGQGILFEHSLAHSPWTLPSHVSLLSSLYPSAHGVESINQKPSENVTLVQEILKRNGYRTAAFTGGGFVGSSYGFDRGFELFVDQRRGTDRWVSQTLDWVRKVKKEKWFVFMHTFAVHYPYKPNPRILKLFTDWTPPDSTTVEEIAAQITDINDISDDEMRTLMLHRFIHGTKIFRKHFGSFFDSSGKRSVLFEMLHRWSTLPKSEEDVSHIVTCYDSTIREVDEAIKKLVEGLEKLKLLSRTIIIITSDHGEEFLERRWIGHGTSLFSEQIHIPLVYYFGKDLHHFPEQMLPGTNRNLSRQIDFLPSILGLLNIDPPPGIQGINLFDEEQSSRSLTSMASLIKPETDFLAIQSDSQKILFDAQKDSFYLYQLTQDRRERHPLIMEGKINRADSTHEDLKTYQPLLRTFKNLHRENENIVNTHSPETLVMSSKLKKQLKALGYIN